MALLLHAVSAELTIAQCEALNNVGLACYSHASLNGLVTCCTPADVAGANCDSLLAYSQLIEAARAVTDIIPMRYGAVFDNPQGLYQSLERNRQSFTRQLQELSGCVEMSVRVPVNAPATEASAVLTGREYLAAKQRLIHHQRSKIKAITESVTGYYVDSKAEYDAANALLRVHFLVKGSQLGLFESGIHRLQLPQLSLSGPCAAYNFVN